MGFIFKPPLLPSSFLFLFYLLTAEVFCDILLIRRPSIALFGAWYSSSTSSFSIFFKLFDRIHVDLDIILHNGACRCCRHGNGSGGNSPRPSQVCLCEGPGGMLYPFCRPILFSWLITIQDFREKVGEGRLLGLQPVT